MKKYKHLLIAIVLPLVSVVSVFAGNPDRQGEAGAYELTINHWARGASYVNCSRTLGVEATYLNPAGVGRLQTTELVLASTAYLRGTGITYSAAGFGLKLNENSAVAVSVAAMDFGNIAKTTAAQPEGLGADFRPLYTNIGITYAYTFEKRLSVGATDRKSVV